MEKTYISSPLDNFEVINEDQPFQTRVTTVDWHPRQANLATIGSKHGDVVFYRVGREGSGHFEQTMKIEGVSC